MDNENGFLGEAIAQHRHGVPGGVGLLPPEMTEAFDALRRQNAEAAQAQERAGACARVGEGLADHIFESELEELLEPPSTLAPDTAAALQSLMAHSAKAEIDYCSPPPPELISSWIIALWESGTDPQRIKRLADAIVIDPLIRASLLFVERHAAEAAATETNGTQSNGHGPDAVASDLLLPEKPDKALH